METKDTSSIKLFDYIWRMTSSNYEEKNRLTNGYTGTSHDRLYFLNKNIWNRFFDKKKDKEVPPNTHAMAPFEQIVEVYKPLFPLLYKEGWVCLGNGRPSGILTTFNSIFTYEGMMPPFNITEGNVIFRLDNGSVDSKAATTTNLVSANNGYVKSAFYFIKQRTWKKVIDAFNDELSKI